MRFLNLSFAIAIPVPISITIAVAVPIPVPVVTPVSGIAASPATAVLFWRRRLGAKVLDLGRRADIDVARVVHVKVGRVRARVPVGVRDPDAQSDPAGPHVVILAKQLEAPTSHAHVLDDVVKFLGLSCT